MTVDPPTLEHVLQAQRGFGRVVCDWQPRTHADEPHADELDAYIETVLADMLDDQQAPDAYRQVSAQYARQLVAFWLANNLAEGTPPVGTEVESSVLQPFFGLFSADPVFFTSTATKTLHDHDAGIVVADRNQIGMIWFADDE